MNNSTKLIVISAPSGTGKTSIIKEILNKYSDKILFSISVTTRPRRTNEVDGVDYYFVQEEEFKRMIENDEFIEWEKIYDYYYGTPKSEIERAKKEGKHILFELDVNGSLKLKKLYPDAITIFIVPPGLEELENRLRKRNTETPETFQKRIERAKMELGMSKHFDFEVKNYNLDEAIQDVEKIIRQVLDMD